MRVLFVSDNEGKIKEVNEILSYGRIEVIAVPFSDHEIQSDSIEDIVLDKVKKAYKKYMRPLFVEHTGLYISDFGNMPGGLTQVFWDALGSDKFCRYFSDGTAEITAESVIAFCDGKSIFTFNGRVKGNVVNAPKGDPQFQWDCIFQPYGSDKTFAEMDSKEKNKISMRRKALDKLRSKLEEYCDDQ